MFPFARVANTDKSSNRPHSSRHGPDDNLICYGKRSTRILPPSNKLVSLPPSTLIILWFPPWFSVPSNPRENPLFRDFRLFHRFFGGTT